MASKRSKRSSHRSVGKRVKNSRGAWIIGLAALGAAGVAGVILMEKKSSAAQLPPSTPPATPPATPPSGGGGGGGGVSYTAPSDNTGDQTQGG